MKILRETNLKEAIRGCYNSFNVAIKRTFTSLPNDIERECESYGVCYLILKICANFKKNYV